jgi:protein-tyrosine-phosphatase
MTKSLLSARWLSSIPLLAMAYFLAYAPYAGLTKALTSGQLLGGGPVSGFVILPATVMATIVTMAALLLGTGWWHSMDTRAIAGLRVPIPRRETLASGLADAVIIGTTTLAFAFEGVSIVLMLLLMRGGVLVMSPFTDHAYHLRIHWFSWIALGLSLTAVSLALTSAEGMTLSLAAILNVSAYLVGYVLRFWCMGRLGKSHDRDARLRYFAEEQLVATPMLLLALALVAMFGRGEMAAGLALGFTEIWARPELLCLFGTLIYLDPHENTYAVPVNRSSSLLAGVAASTALALIYGSPMPGPVQLLGGALLIAASVVLGFGPHLARGKAAERLILFVCSGNNCRSAMAERLAMLEASRRLGVSVERLRASGLVFASAGLTAKDGEEMEAVAVNALTDAGAPATGHRSQSVTPQLLARAEVVICLTPEYRDRVLEMAPWVSARVHLLDPAGGAVEKPADGNFVRFASEVLAMVRSCFDRLEIVPAKSVPG